MRQRHPRSRPARYRLGSPPPIVRATLRRTVEGLAAVGSAFGPIPVLAWLYQDDEPAQDQRPAAGVQLSRAERRQWARLVNQLR